MKKRSKKQEGEKKERKGSHQHYRRLQTSYHRNIIGKHIKPRDIEIPSVVIITVLLITLITILQPQNLDQITGAISGLTTLGEKRVTYMHIIDKIFDASDTYIWIPEHKGRITSVKISGTLIGENAKLNLKTENKTYLILDSEALEKEPSQITGYVVKDLEGVGISDVDIININDTNNKNKTIQTRLEYQKGTAFDADDDGIESVYGAIDFITENTFNWDVNEANLCTRWEIESLENLTIVNICFGARHCCNFVDLEPISDKWDEALYLTFGKYGATHRNLVSAQTIYADIINAEIYYSDWSSLPAEFIEKEFITPVSFENVCLETCTLPELEQAYYDILIDLENTTIIINNITYTVIEGIEEIINITIPEITNVTNITIPEEIISIEKVKEEITQLSAEIGKPVKWVRIVKNKSEITLPQTATNLVIKKVVEEKETPVVGLLTLEQIIPLNESEEYVIEYETQAPIASESIINEYKKQITVSSDIHYTNVLAYTSIKESPQSAIKLYWYDNESKRIDVTGNINYNLSFIDNNNNNLIDKIQWIIPSLSNQTFEVEIVILNTYTFVRDYENWTVAFNTTGEADLIISSTNAGWTEFLKDNNETFDEMKFVDIKCGDIILNDDLILIDFNNNSYNYNELTYDDSIDIKQLIVYNYSCNDTGYITNFMYKAGYAILEFNFGGQIAYAYDPSNWWNTDWNYRRKISFDKDVTSKENLTDFPVLIILTTTTPGYDKTYGTDLRFIDSDNTTVLKHHIEVWNTTGNSYVWVKVPQILNDTTDYIWMYYNSSGASNVEDESGTFNVNYTAVWHFNETSGTVNDSTIYGNDGTATGGPTFYATGKADGGMDFDGIDDYIATSGPTWTPSTFSVEWWTYPLGHINYNYQIFALPTGWDMFMFHSEANGGIYVGIDVSTRFDTTDLPAGTLALNQWQHFVYTYDGTQGSFYKDGKLLAGPKAQTSPSAWEGFRIGTTDTGTVNGTIDEVRISNVSRSASWINASYLTMNNQYITLGSEEEQDDITPTWSGMSNTSINGSIKGFNISWGVNLADNIELDYAYLETNDTGTWTNKTLVELSGASATLNETYIITADPKSYVCGKYWFNDTNGNSNESSEECFVTDYCMVTNLNITAATEILRMSNWSNAHAEQGNQSSHNYTYKVYCDGGDILNITNTCSGTHTTILHLSDTSNAHAELNNVSHYSNNVCIGTNTSKYKTQCVYETDCSYHDSCIASISFVETGNESNNHIADCVSDPYSMKICCNMTAADLSPTWTNIYNNASTVTVSGGDVNWTANISDDVGLSYAWLEHNGTNINNDVPALVNESIIAISGTNYNISKQITINVSGGNYTCARFWFNDTSNNVNKTDWSCFTVIETTPPTWTNIYNNASTVTPYNGVVNWTANISDDISLSYAWLEENATQTSGTTGLPILNNQSIIAISSSNYNVSQQITVAIREGNYTCGRFWFNDTSNNVNKTDWSCFTVADKTPPSVTSVTDTPDPQGLGENITISATVTDNYVLSTVLFEITDPNNVAVNFTNTTGSGNTYTLNYLNYTNGTYNYKIYANDTSGNLNDTMTGSFEIYSNLTIQVKTEKDSYGANEVVNITDPPGNNDLRIKLENINTDVRNASWVNVSYLTMNEQYITLGGEEEPVAEQVELVSMRTRSSKTFDLGDGKRALDVSTGSIHYRDDSGVWQDINTTLVPSSRNIVGFGNPAWEMVENEYEMFVMEELNSGTPLVRYVSKNTDYWVQFVPHNLQWVNDLNQIGFIATPNTVSTLVSNNEATWKDVYGSNISLRFVAGAGRMQKWLDIYDNNSLPAPPQYVIDGGGVALEFTEILSFHNDLEVWINGTKWDKKTEIGTVTEIEFRSPDGEVRFVFPVAVGYHEGEEDAGVIGKLHLKKSDNKLYVTVRFPWSWLESATYPVHLDATVDKQVGASADDAYCQTWDYWYSAEATVVVGGDQDLGGCDGLYRFTGITISGTVDVAYIQLYGESDGSRDVHTNVSVEKADNPATPTSCADFYGRTRTTAKVAWDTDATWGNTSAWRTSPSLVASFQELVNAYTISDDAVNVLHDSDYAGGGDHWSLSSTSYNSDPDYAAKLHIEYTPHAPTWSNVYNNASTVTVSGGDVNWTANISDDVGLSYAILTTNDTGTWTNQTLTAISGTNYNFSYKYTITAGDNTYVCGKMWFNDTSNNANETDDSCFTTSYVDVNQSKIVNKGSTNTSIYVLMKVQYYNTATGVWVDDDVVVNDTTPRRIQANNELKLDTLFNDKWNTTANASYGDGTYRVIAIITDNNDNTLTNYTGSILNATYNFSVTGVDVTAPTWTNIYNNASTTTKTNGHVNWTANMSDESGLRNAWLEHNATDINNDVPALVNESLITINGKNYNVSKEITINVTRGNYTCARFWFNDTGNNVNSTDWSCFTVANTPPTIPDTFSPSKINSTNSSETLSCSGSTDADNDAINYEFYINTTANPTTLHQNTTSTTYTFTPDSSGAYYWRCRAHDSYDASSYSADQEIYFDLIEPYTTISIYNNASTVTPYNGIVNWTANISDDMGLSYAWLEENTTQTSGTTGLPILNNQSIIAISSSNYNVSQQITVAIREGNYTCGRFWFNDTLNNLNSTGWSCFTVADVTPPSVTSVTDTPDPQGLGENVTISATITDYSLDTVLFQITNPNNNAVNFTNTTGSGNTYSLNFLNYTNGTYTYTIFANDTSGNMNSTETGSFEIYSNLTIQVKTEKDSYGANEIVNITDPTGNDGLTIKLENINININDNNVENKKENTSTITKNNNENKENDIRKDDDYLSNFSTSSSDITLTNFCFFNLGSLDQIGDLLSVKDNAKSGTSFKWGDIFFALDKNLAYSSSETGLTICSSAITNMSNSTLESLDDSKILSFKSDNSEYTKSGARNSYPAFLNFLTNLKTFDFLKKEKSTLVSTIKNIFYKPCLLATLSFNSSANSLALSSDSFDLEAIFSASSNNISSLTSSLKALSRALLTTLFQSISCESLTASSSNSLGTLTFNSAIPTTSNHKNSESVYKAFDSDESEQLTSLVQLSPNLWSGLIFSPLNRCGKRKLSSWKEPELKLDFNKNTQKPTILNASVKPTKVTPGQTMTITAQIIDSYGIKSVTADMAGIEVIDLELKEGNIYEGIWNNTWKVHSTTTKQYETTITATNILGKKAIKTLSWEDPLTLEYQPDGTTGIDTYMSGLSNPDRRHYNYGTYSYLRVGWGAGTSDDGELRSLVKINWSGTGLDPSNTSIDKVVIGVKVSGFTGGDINVSLHQLFTGFEEGTSTGGAGNASWNWNSTAGGRNWLGGVSGTDYNATSMNWTVITGNGWFNISIPGSIADSWFDGTIEDNGFIMIGNATTQTNELYIYTSDYATAADRIIYFITYMEIITLTWENIYNNASTVTVSGGDVNWTANISDETALSYATLTTNDTGTWTNQTLTAISGTNYNFSYKYTITAGDNTYVCGKVWFNDTSNNANETDDSCFTTSFVEKNQSKIKNIGSTNTSIYVLMKVQFFNTATQTWVDEEVVVNDTTPRRIQNGSELKLDTLFNGKWNTTQNASNGDGTYRVIAIVTDNNDNTLSNYTGSILNATYNFTISGLIDETPPTWTNIHNNASTVTKVSGHVNWTANISDENALSYAWLEHNATNIDNDVPALMNESIIAISGTNYNVSKQITTNVTRGNYTCARFWFNDTGNNVNKTDWSCFTVANTVPTVPSLSYPDDKDYTFTNRTPRFNWTSSTDADNDGISYHIHVSLTEDFTDQSINEYGLSNNYYDATNELEIKTYWWRVSANDSLAGYSDNSSVYNFTIVKSVTLSLQRDNIQFGTVSLGTSYDTEDDSPLPILVQNDGTWWASLVNISANQSLWTQQALGTSYWQIKAGNSTENGSFDWANSVTTWTNVPSTNVTTFIKDLNYTDNNDTAEIEVRITVPSDEPAGNKTSYLVLWWEESPT